MWANNSVYTSFWLTVAHLNWPNQTVQLAWLMWTIIQILRFCGSGHLCPIGLEPSFERGNSIWTQRNTSNWLVTPLKRVCVRGGGIINPQIWTFKQDPKTGLFEHEVDGKFATWFSENEGWFKGHLELFRKFIRFGGVTCPLCLHSLPVSKLSQKLCQSRLIHREKKQPPSPPHLLWKITVETAHFYWKDFQRWDVISSNLESPKIKEIATGFLFHR